jgi:hypothetical protein
MASPANALTPPHITVFDKFFESTGSHLEALVAYGLFMESIRNWPHTGANIDRLFESNKKFCLDKARVALLQAAAAAIHEQRSEIATAHKGFRLWGVAEAVLGALCWSVALVAMGLLAFYLKPDLFELPRHAVQQQQPQQQPPPH